MNNVLHLIDWCVVGGLIGIVTLIALTTRKYNRTVADFLAANRCAGRYLLAIAQGEASVGAIGYVAAFQMSYEAGWTADWWYNMMIPMWIVLALSGWIIYRFRASRVLTTAQFFEVRYSRRFRIFMGIMAFVSGIITIGIFPAVGSHFFLYYCGFPSTVALLGLNISIHALLMILIIGISLFFTLLGGQIAVIVTDFVQGIFTYAILIIILLFIFICFGWNKLAVSWLAAPAGKSLINPFSAAEHHNFNFWFFVIGTFIAFYQYKTFQGIQGFNVSAKSAHEAKMAGILGTWRGLGFSVLCVMLPLMAYALMHDPGFASHANRANAILAAINNTEIRNQMIVPVAIAQVLPVGILGGFLAVMLAATIATLNTYLHSYGSIFIQDIIMPFRTKPFASDQHMRLLRLSMVGVAVFIFFFSLIFKQTQHLYMYMALTGAIYAGGAGSVLIGGLYWRRGTTTGAWSAMITGATLAAGGMVIHSIYPEFPITGQWLAFITMVCSILAYTLVSVGASRKEIDMNRLFHRDGDSTAPEESASNRLPRRKVLGERLGLTSEFSRFDKTIYWGTIIWTVGWFIVFVLGTVYGLCVQISDESWLAFWYYRTWLWFGVGSGVLVWFSIGGIIDIKSLYRSLRTAKRDTKDDGMIFDGTRNKEEIVPVSLKGASE